MTLGTLSTLSTLSVFVAWPEGSPDGRDARALCRALEQELAELPGAPAGRLLSSVLIAGAGVPSPACVAAFLANLERRLRIAPGLEVTLEVGARVAAQRLADYRAAGITRLALRAGALDDATEAALRAATRFARTSIDLAFARPGQTLAHWQAELDRAVQLGTGHVSIEEHDAAHGTDPDIAAAFYDLAQGRLTGAGRPPYEIAHFARPGHEARHLLHGARGGDYLGIGPGAVGRITLGRSCLASTQLGPSAWLEAVEAGREVAERQMLTPEERLAELLVTGLRLCAGVERAWFEPLVGGTLESMLAAKRLEPLIEDGFVVLDEAGLRLSARGWLLCESVLARLLA